MNELPLNTVSAKEIQPKFISVSSIDFSSVKSPPSGSLQVLNLTGLCSQGVILSFSIGGKTPPNVSHSNYVNFKKILFRFCYFLLLICCKLLWFML